MSNSIVNKELKSRNAPPRAGAMLESLRGLGYSTSAALADIVDNSISAGANKIEIDFIWEGTQSRISILDNGSGMDDNELEAAMRLGDKNPLIKRNSSDLGRFGMGLKTASFSQCRRLTVASSKSNSISCLRWDLEELKKVTNGEWLLFEGTAQGSEGFISDLDKYKNGTMVLWEDLDKIVTKGYTTNDFLDLIDHVERHLSMVFHRLLEGSKSNINILINKKSIKPWDPFMVGHTGKPWNSPVVKQVTDSGVIEVECHVLPHRDKLTQEEFDTAAGPEGWTSQQGFYVYRNQRLLLAGGWLGLGQGRAWNREEAFRLARIRLDIPNSADADWKIDIRKSIARPPVSIRPWLTRLAEDTRDRARKVFAYRGNNSLGHTARILDQAWRVEHLRAGIKYKIDEKHAAVASVLDALVGADKQLVKAMLKVIEETVPVQRIWLDTADNKETPQTGFSGESNDKVSSVLKIFYEDMIKRKGMSPTLAKKTLLSTEPFHNFPYLINALEE